MSSTQGDRTTSIAGVLSRTINGANDTASALACLFRLVRGDEFTPHSLDLNGAAGRVLALLSSDFPDHRIVPRSEIADDLPTATGDPIGLQQTN
jgi:hypothetical protein